VKKEVIKIYFPAFRPSADGLHGLKDNAVQRRERPQRKKYDIIGYYLIQGLWPNYFNN